MYLARKMPTGAALIASIFLYCSMPLPALAEQSGLRWVLFYIEVAGGVDRLQRLGHYDTMLECFDAWSKVEKDLPKPKINFQIICIHTKHEKVAQLPG